MKNYRFDWYAYIMVGFMGFLSFGMYKMSDDSIVPESMKTMFLIFSFTFGVIAVITLVNMVMTVIYVDDECIIKRNLFGTKRIMIGDIIRITEAKGRHGSTAGIKLHSAYTRLQISVAIKDFPYIIDKVMSIKGDVYTGRSMEGIIRRTLAGKYIITIVFVLVIIFFIYSTFQFSSYSKMADKYEQKAEEIMRLQNDTK